MEILGLTHGVLLLLLCGIAIGTHEDCPWFGQDEGLPDEIKANCICATNINQNYQLSVQCQDINAQTLVAVLQQFNAGGNDQPLELLYLNGSKVTDEEGTLPPKLFAELKIISLQLSGCRIKSVHPEAFRESEQYLKHLSLSQNEITSVPTEAIEGLGHLTLLDLSFNKITHVPKGTFHTLGNLATLKLNDNTIDLHPDAFVGLEGSLRNLNLKGTRISHVPEAIANLSSLAFLDLAQNRLRDLEPSYFRRLHSLTALNLERNLLQSLPENVFEGINDTLSSLSLLNNLITTFPKTALIKLHELRVLDLGFNLLTEVPQDAFTGLHSLTLLALDGNPLPTLEEASFGSLSKTLRGLSLGGRFLNCDCRLKWILRWTKEHDLQVTSREKNPPFCGSPDALKTLNFNQIQSNDLKCSENTTEEESVPTTTTVVTSSSSRKGVEYSPLEQEIAENKTQFIVQVSPPPTTQFEQSRRSNNGSSFTTPTGKFKPRRQRPPKFPKPIPLTTTTTTTTNPTGVDDDDRRQFPSTEDDHYYNQQENTEGRIGSLTPSTPPSLRIVAPVYNTVPRNQPEFTFITAPSSSTTTSTSIPPTRTFIKNPHPIRPTLPPLRHRISSATRPPPTSTTLGITVYADDLVPSSTTTLQSTLSTTTTTAAPTTTIREITNVAPASFKPSSPIPPPPSSSSSSPRPPRQQISSSPHRIPTSKAIGTVLEDDDKIPVISGVGSAISSPNLNTGSIMTVKQQAPTIQTQGSPSNIVQKPIMVVGDSDHMHPSHGPHHHHHPHRPHSSPPSSSSHILHHVPPSPPNLVFAEKSEIVVQDIGRSGDSINVHWESLRPTAGFRVMYRLFGEDSFHHGTPLAATETEYKIKNVPTNECIIVCIVPYEDILYNDVSPSAASVPPGSQCREVKPSPPSLLMNHMDKITVGASAAICVTVLIAVLIFYGITKRSKAKRPSSASTLMAKLPPSAFLPPSPSHNMVTSSSSGGDSGGRGGVTNGFKDWDQMSVISTKSIPRARVFHGSMDGLATMKTATINPHFHRGGGLEGIPTHRSFSHHHHHHPNSNTLYSHNHSHSHSYSYQHPSQQQQQQHQHPSNHHGGAANAVNNYLSNQNRLLRASLGSRASYDALNKLTSTRQSHQQLEHARRKRSARLNQSESLNTLNGYETPDNWTDHDMDFYVARNQTQHARHDLVQL